MALTDRQIKTAKAAEKAYKLYDSKGLFLHVQKNGSKYWRLKYRYMKKEKLLAVGVYPDVSLKEARTKADQARKKLADGFDPSGEKQLDKLKRYEAAQNSFEFIARQLFERKKMPEGARGRIKGRWGDSHYSKQLSRLENELLPWLAKRPNARHPRKPMSDGAVNSAMRRLGISKEEFCGHGFRAMARTMLDERLKVRPEFVEAQLGHAVKDANGRAYNRTAYLEDRAVMMQQWADYLDVLKAQARGENVTPIYQSKTA